ncbi:hypothetical protein [Corynebacterium pyruviciproducens]|nr:hypothetical protein [Corynebacterium pyruviciproducens]
MAYMSTTDGETESVNLTSKAGGAYYEVEPAIEKLAPWLNAEQVETVVIAIDDGETVEINGYTFWSDLPEG